MTRGNYLYYLAHFLHHKKSSRKKITSRERRRLLRHEIPDPPRAEFHGARTTSPPRTVRLRIRAASYNRKRDLPRDELVSLRRWRNLRRRRTETSSALRRPRSCMSPAARILRRFVRGGLVARALWNSASAVSGISSRSKTTFSRSDFFS